MKFDIKINNIGKLKDAKVSVRPLTILAGPNNTGKSFVSKILYSIFHSLNISPIFRELAGCIRAIDHELDMIEHFKKDIGADPSTFEKVKKSKELIKGIRNSEWFKKLYIGSEIDPDLRSLISELIETYKSIEKGGKAYELLTRFYPSTGREIEPLEKILESTGEEAFLNAFSEVLEDELEGNFQIPRLGDLIGSKGESANIHFGEKGKIEITDTSIKTDMSTINLMNLKNQSRSIIYLESPLYWKQRKALTSWSYTDEPYISRRRKSIKVPSFFKKLNSWLNDPLTGEPDFEDILQDITENIIKGRIAIDKTGDLGFIEKDQSNSIPLYITATGITQIGLIALLIERKILDKGSVLFIDEPETNLHPAWQVQMMEILFRLVKSGAKVVMATHSVDMLHWLSKNLPLENVDLVSINQMTVQKDGTATTSNTQETDVYKRIKLVKKDLTKPFAKLFLKEDPSKEKEQTDA